jgi:trigger factor
VKTTTTMLEDGRARLEVVLEAEQVEHDLRHTLGHLVDSAKIPGFRKGKVPPSVVLQRMGREEVFEETMREFLPSWVGEAIAEARLHPADRPSVDFENVPAEGEPFTFTAEFPLRPTGTLPAELELEGVQEDIAIPPDEVDAELERLREETAPLAVVERGAQTGDFVEVDMHVSAGGKTVPEASTVGYLVPLGTGRTFEEIERALRGMTAGETRHTKLPLPTDYPDAKLRGRDADVELTVHSVRERRPLPLGDEFAGSASEFDTLAELRDAIEGSFRERLENLARSRFRASVLASLGEAIDVDLPPYIVAGRVEELLGDLARNVERQGMPFRAFLAQSGRSIEEISQALLPDAIGSLRRELALEAFAEREKIGVDDSELERVLREELDDEEDVDAAVQEVLASRAKEAARDELRLQRALDRACEVATPITAEQQAAREQLWTPGDDEKTEPAVAKPTIWTPGQPR